MQTIVQAEFRLFGTIKREGKWVIAHCPPLDVTTQGKTVAEAKKNLMEASELFLISCIERATLDLALRELGFVLLQGRQESIPHNAFRFPVQVPFGLSKPRECRA